MARVPLTGMPSPGYAEPYFLSSEADWGTNYAVDYANNNNGTITLGLDEHGMGYDLGTTPDPPWQFDTSDFITFEIDNAQTDYSKALHIEGDPLTNQQWVMYVDYFDGIQPGLLHFSYYEEQGSNGHFYAIVDDAGNEYLRFGTNNPQVVVYDDSGETVLQSNFNTDYQRWREFEVEINWVDETYDLEWRDYAGNEATINHTGPLDTSQASGGVSKAGVQAAATTDPNLYGRVDNVSSFYRSNGWSTGPLDVGFSTADMEVTLDYNLNGQSCDLDIYSYDSEGATPEPPDTYTLTGSNTTFTSTHGSATNWWGLRFNMSTNDPTVTPEIYAADFTDNA